MLNPQPNENQIFNISSGIQQLQKGKKNAMRLFKGDEVTMPV